MTNWIAGGAIVGTLAAGWKYVTWITNQISTFIVGKVVLEQDAAYQALAYFWWYGQCNRYGSRCYRPHGFWVKPLNSFRLVLAEDVKDNPRLFWVGWTPFFITRGEGDEKRPQSITIQFPRILIGPDMLIGNIENAYHKHIQYQVTGNRYSVRRLIGRGPMLGRQSNEPTKHGEPPSGNNPMWAAIRPVLWQRDELHIGGSLRGQYSYLDQIALSEDARKMLREFDHWFKSEQWYRDHSIAWRRGFLLTGSPGTGKTTIINALAHDYNLPIMSLDLSTMTNSEFTSYWQEAQSQKPIIILIEDIDGVFEGRQNILGDKGGGLTFDCLLNMVSGIQSNDGVCLFVTTNRPETLDTALASYNSETGKWILRPGRIDRVIEVTPPDAEGRKLIAERILKEWPFQIEALVKLGDGETGAQFEERCIRQALHNFWER